MAVFIKVVGKKKHGYRVVLCIFLSCVVYVDIIVHKH